MVNTHQNQLFKTLFIHTIYKFLQSCRIKPLHVKSMQVTFIIMAGWSCGGGVCAGSGSGSGGGVGGGVGSPSARASRRPDSGHSVSSRLGLAGGMGPSSRGNGSSTPSDDSDDCSHCTRYVSQLSLSTMFTLYRSIKSNADNIQKSQISIDTQVTQ